MESDRILGGAGGQDDPLRAGPAALIEQVEKICGPSVWQWPDDLEDRLFVEWALRQLDCPDLTAPMWRMAVGPDRGVAAGVLWGRGGAAGDCGWVARGGEE